ncbi:ATP-binding protein [Thiolinea disciformis]|uniref:ATP-binding protein n=1 Tax=Thiolinea disciformis TaxID=125614 RepID=UPI00037883E0|nr:ATP-binding protein [Thiolinea disciformis]
MKTLNAWLAQLAKDATPRFDECVAQLGADLPLLLRFKETPQDAQWHAEGSVHIHTGMVLEELYQLLQTEAQHIQGAERQALILGACLHDIAKPMCTKTYEKEGRLRIGSSGHEDKGRSYLAPKLMKWQLDFSVVWTVLNLVGEHQIPRQLILRQRNQAAFLSLARQSNMQLLYWLERADIQGRLCADKEMDLLVLEEFRALCQHYGVWDRSDPLAIIRPALAELSPGAQDYVRSYALAELASGKITQAEEALSTTYTHREHYAHLIIACGLSGSGKSTWLQNHFPQYERISLDELREQWNGDRASQEHSGEIRQQAKEQLKAVLRAKRGVIWDATNLRQDFRSTVADLGRDYHALVTLVVFLLPETELRKNNRAREHVVPDAVLDRQLESYQFPTVDEAHQFWVVGAKGEMLWQE